MSSYEKKRANRILTILIFIFLYVPMAVLIVASFNTGKDVTQFEGFTLRQYARLFQDRTLLKLLGNSCCSSRFSRQLHRHGLRHGGVTEASTT